MLSIERSNIVRVAGALPDAFVFEERAANLVDAYAKLDHGAYDISGEFSALYVELTDAGGATGIFGPIDREQALIISDLLGPFMVGRGAFGIELVHDQMMRLDRHGRSGSFMKAVSAVDCALWDLAGKVRDEPVYRLLGGPTRTSVPAYASALGFSVEPDRAARRAEGLKAQGFEAQKWFFRFGPRHGAEGIEKNLAMARSVREAVGSHYRLMFDAVMSWTKSYAAEMLRKLEAISPYWMEEPVPPERVAELADLRQASTVPIATGEHVFTRWQTAELLRNGAVDWLQNDPDWTGGITEQMKVCALASSFGVPVVAHGHSLLPALHVAAAQAPTTVPMVEFLVNWQPVRQYFHKPWRAPERGLVSLPDTPGLGFELDEDKIDSRETVRFS
jgi:L-alanine-DL-glutamate epimerase-like enolase superfamily enzyme